MAVAAGAGWLLAAGALAAAALLQRELARRAELIARACHEARGPLHAARLGLHLLALPAGPAGPRVAAIDVELRRAGLALEDLHAARAGSRARDRAEPVDVRALVSTAVAAWRPRGGRAPAHRCASTLRRAGRSCEATVCASPRRAATCSPMPSSTAGAASSCGPVPMRAGSASRCATTAPACRLPSPISRAGPARAAASAGAGSRSPPTSPRATAAG